MYQKWGQCERQPYSWSSVEAFQPPAWLLRFRSNQRPTGGRRTGPRLRLAVLIACGGLLTAALAAIPGPYPLVVALSMATGMIRGNLTLAQATAVTDRWGAAHYGRLSGLLGALPTAAGALAPFASAALAGLLGGYPHLFALLAAVAAVAALAATRT